MSNPKPVYEIIARWDKTSQSRYRARQWLFASYILLFVALFVLFHWGNFAILFVFMLMFIACFVLSMCYFSPISTRLSCSLVPDAVLGEIADSKDVSWLIKKEIADYLEMSSCIHFGLLFDWEQAEVDKVQKEEAAQQRRSGQGFKKISTFGSTGSGSQSILEREREQNA